jgi:hypothetical protein
LSSRKNEWIPLLAAAVVSIILLVAVIWSIMYIIQPGISLGGNMPEVILTLIVIAGVAGLLASLSMVTVILAALGLSDQKEALGLPKGSVRALIALSLIIIFAIMSLYLYGRLDGTPTQEQTRFAQQILTTVSTLVVAVAAFYFGTRSVEAARETVEEPKIRISPSGEQSLDITKDKALQIKVETTPQDEKTLWSVAGDKQETLIQVKPNEFKYTPSEDLSDGKEVTLTFALARHGDVSKTLRVKVKNTQTSAG